MALNVRIFNALTLNDRLDIIRRHGEYMTKIEQLGYTINLYLVDDVFVEVYFDGFSTGVQMVKVLDVSEERMNLFAYKVDLSDLFGRL
ncbi:MAG: hypothetical protein V4565_00425 [Bacteroidota bacterium]